MNTKGKCNSPAIPCAECGSKFVRRDVRRVLDDVTKGPILICNGCVDTFGRDGYTFLDTPDGSVDQIQDARIAVDRTMAEVHECRSAVFLPKHYDAIEHALAKAEDEFSPELRQAVRMLSDAKFHHVGAKITVAKLLSREIAK